MKKKNNGIEWKTEKRRVADLISLPSNPRILTEKQAEDLKKSLNKFNLVEIPVINTDNVIIAGHQRIKVLGLLDRGNDKIDVRVPLRKLSKKEVKEYNIRSNKNTGSWDFDILGNDFEMEELIDWGFTEDELVGLPFGKNNKEDEVEEVPETPKKPKTKTGDLYELGNHRLLCGDSTVIINVDKLMDGKKAVLINTDPPYGIDFVNISKSKGQSKKYSNIKNDDLINGKELQDFLEKMIRVAVPHLIDNVPFYLWHPMLTQGTFFAAAAAAAADIIINRQIIWVKPQFVFGRGDYHWKHELCFYGWRRGFKPVFYGERNQHTIWEVGRENDGIHPTQKPVDLFVIPIKNHTKKGELVYDPFGGSGSQLIACEKTERKCYMIEIDPIYCDVIVTRWNNLTGKNSIKLNGKKIEWKSPV